MRRQRIPKEPLNGRRAPPTAGPLGEMRTQCEVRSIFRGVGVYSQSSNAAGTTEAPALQLGLPKTAADRFESAPRLNNRGFALANRSLALTPAPGKPKGENY